jgi:UDP-galactopyranose mutase
MLPFRFFVFSHLRWDFVYQRPQHIFSRLAKTCPVLFVEEPVRSKNGEIAWELANPIPNVIVARLQSPLPYQGFADVQLELIAEKLDELKALTSAHFSGEMFSSDEMFSDCAEIAWMYSPLACPLLDRLEPDLVVFDSMDALDHFANAPAGLKERETDLLKRADLVFTGGPSLQRRLEGRHGNLYCFSSSVDAAHFEQARQSSTDKNPVLPKGVRLGYVGVIDERIDLALVAEVAALRPQWQIVMVGPTAKINPKLLPKASNIHFLGQQAYADLPGFIAGWDICIQPFAHNDATKYISPTKTLEFFAARKPVVSTSITDVAQPYGHIVFLADNPAEFVTQVEQALNPQQNRWASRVAAMREVLDNTSWDKTTSQMLNLINIALEKGLRIQRISAEVGAAGPAAGAGAKAREKNQFHIEWDVPNSPGLETEDDPAPGVVTDHSAAIAPDAKVVIVGAGPTGLSAAYHLKDHALLIEKNSSVGGWCRSLKEEGFTFDFAGHIMFSNDPYVHEMYQLLLGDNCHWQDREAWVYSHGVHTRYPFQGALYGLPPDVIRECIMGAIEARFGSSEGLNQTVANDSLAADDLKTSSSSQNLKETLKGKAKRSGKALESASVCKGHEDLFGDVKDCCADGVLESTAPLKRAHFVPESNGSSNRNANGHGHTRETSGDAPSMENGNGSHYSIKADGTANNNHGAKSNGASGVNGSSAPGSFEEFIYQVWGRGIAKHFAIPYNRKLWAVPLSDMETSWLGGRVPQPNLEEMIDGALQPVAKPQGPNARFGYPLKGGFQALMDGFLTHVKDNLLLNTRIDRVSVRDRVIIDGNGREIPFEVLISTMPLPLLIKALGNEAPLEIQEATKKLRYVSVRCVNLGIGREKLTEKHWIYYPGASVFHRIFVQGNASPYCNPKGGFGLTCEITYSPHKPLPCEGDALVERCIEDCIEVGIMQATDPVLVANQVDMPFAYVVYDHARSEVVAKIRAWLKQHRILLAGRYSEWEYYNSDHAFVAGKRVAERAREMLHNHLPSTSAAK